MKIGKYWCYNCKNPDCIKITGDGGTGTGIACHDHADVTPIDGFLFFYLLYII
jgi:hypothetical protein